MSGPVLLLAALLVPATTALGVALFAARPNLREAVTLLGAATLFLVTVLIARDVFSGGRPELVLAEPFPGVALALAVEPLGMLFALVASTLWIANSVYSIGYMRGNDEKRQTGFYVCFAIALFATMGLAYSKNLLTLFLFYELLTFSTYPLVTHKRDEKAIAAGRVYLLILVSASMLFLLPAILLTGLAAGTFDFRPGGILADRIAPWMAPVLLGFFVFGAAKAAVMPLHRWLPAAMVAPTPVSALLHAVAVVKAGVFVVLKVVLDVFGLDYLEATGAADWLVFVAAFTVVAASVVALFQDDLKRRLAYSTIGQLGYVVLAAALATPASTLGGALHIAAHGVSKITLFFAAGAIYTAAHRTKVSQLDGIGRRMPVTMAAFTLGVLSMIGLPPTIGFASKWFMIGGAVSAGSVVAVAAIVVSTVLNALYLLPIVWRAYARPATGPEHGEAPWPAVAALAATGIGTVLLFLFPAVPYELARMAVEARP